MSHTVSVEFSLCSDITGAELVGGVSRTGVLSLLSVASDCPTTFRSFPDSVKEIVKLGRAC
jgi:hypothetical protein